jgi:hypothetical protein
MAITGKLCLIHGKMGYAALTSSVVFAAGLDVFREKNCCCWRGEVPFTKLVLWKGGLWLDGSLRVKPRTV